MRKWSILLLTTLLGCDLFSVETKVDDVCMNLSDRAIDGAPTGKLVRTYTTDQLAALDGFISVGAELTDVRVGLKATSGVSDLAFLKTVKVSLGAAGLPTLDMVDCQDSECASATTETSIQVDVPPNLIDYALGGEVIISLTVEGALPRTDWVADVEICFSGKASMKVGL